MTARRPIGDVLAGLDINSLPDGWTVLEVVCVIRCLDEEGDPVWCTRGTAGLSTVETIGALVAASDVSRRHYADDWEDEE